MYKKPLLQAPHKAPAGFASPQFVVEPLNINHAIMDLEAVTASTARLRHQYPEANGWPLGITLHDNIADLGWHEKEHRDGSSFAYTVLSPSRDRCLGCIYLIPEGAGAKLSFWMRPDLIDGPTEHDLSEEIRQWVVDAWRGIDIRISDFCPTDPRG